MNNNSYQQLQSLVNQSEGFLTRQNYNIIATLLTSIQSKREQIDTLEHENNLLVSACLNQQSLPPSETFQQDEISDTIINRNRENIVVLSNSIQQYKTSILDILNTCANTMTSTNSIPLHTSPSPVVYPYDSNESLSYSYGHPTSQTNYTSLPSHMSSHPYPVSGSNITRLSPSPSYDTYGASQSTSHNLSSNSQLITPSSFPSTSRFISPAPLSTPMNTPYTTSNSPPVFSKSCSPTTSCLPMNSAVCNTIGNVNYSNATTSSMSTPNSFSSTSSLSAMNMSNEFNHSNTYRPQYNTSQVVLNTSNPPLSTNELDYIPSPLHYNNNRSSISSPSFPFPSSNFGSQDGSSSTAPSTPMVHVTSSLNRTIYPTGTNSQSMNPNRGQSTPSPSTLSLPLNFNYNKSKAHTIYHNISQGSSYSSPATTINASPSVSIPSTPEYEMLPSNWKTQLCIPFMHGCCPRSREECSFAHGEEDLREGNDKHFIHHPKYKTSLCQYYLNGTCRFDACRCKFAHGEQDLRH